MEQHRIKEHPQSKKKNQIIKWLGFALVTVGFFAVGLAVGRGSIHLGRLSSTISTGGSGVFDYSSVDQVYKLLNSDFDGNLDKGKLLDGIKSGLVSATGDPYTEYFNPKDAKDFNDQLSGSFTGIGAELGSDSDNNIVIVSPLSGYPAQKAGLKPKDVIAAVNGQTTSGMSVGAVVRKIRGPEGSSVTLTMVRDNGKPFDVKITRTLINIPSVTYSVKGKIGYLKVNQFTKDTVELAGKAAEQFKAKGVKAIVLDLRGNPGGYLDGAVSISSMWLQDGKTVVSERRGNAVLSTKYSSGDSPFKGIPTVVLIDNGSASASEITAGALRDNGVATLVGVKSFGKGSVQEVEDLADGSEVKITIARWYTPAGRNIDKQGITPDVVVKISDADQKASIDPQKVKAYQILSSKL